jgi:hypothetical protein
VIGVVNTVLPDFSNFDWRIAIVDQLNVITPASELKIIGYGVAYVAVILTLTIIVFNEKQF